MKLLSSRSTLKFATNCQTNWQMATRARKSQTLATLADANNARMPLAMGAEVREIMGGEIGDNGILLDDTIVSRQIDFSFTLDRSFGLPSCPNSIHEIIGTIGSPSQNYRHNNENENENEKLFTRLLGGLNPPQLSGRYRPKPTVPQ